MSDIAQVTGNTGKSSNGTYGPVVETGPLSADERLTGRFRQGELRLAVDDFDLPALERGSYAEGIASVPDENPFVTRETRRFHNTYISKLGIFLYVFGLGLYVARAALGDLPAIPDWVPWATIGGCGLTAVLLSAAVKRRPRPWVSTLFTLVSAGILTLALVYHGPSDAFSALYLLTLVVPMLFYPRRWAVASVAGVSILSMLPYIWGPAYSVQGMFSQILIRIPVYIATTLCVNVVMTDVRQQWKESSKQRRLTRDLAVIHQLTTYIASTHDIKAICDTVVSQLSSSFGYRYAGIYLLQDDKLKLMAQNGYDRAVTDVSIVEGVLSRVVQTGKALLVSDTHAQRGFVRVSEGIRCEAAAPILRRRRPDDGVAGGWSGKTVREQLEFAQARTPAGVETNGHSREDGSVLGVITLEDKAPGALGEVDINLISTVAGALSVALENAVLMQQWQERGERLEVVNRIAQAIAAQLDLPGVLQAARESLHGLVPVDRVTLSLLTEDERHLEIAAMEGIGADNLAQRGTLIPIEELQPNPIADGEWAIVEQLAPGSPYPVLNRLYETGIRSHIAIPLLSGGKAVGLFALSALQANAYTQEHMAILGSIAPHLATAVQNAQLYRDIKLRAETDNLTGLLNLPTFYTRLEESLEQSKATRQPVSVVMLDLDLFKSYNDSFGHVAGDSVLRQVARLIRERVGAEGVAARYGGDEFSVILRGLSTEDAVARIAELCETLGRTPFHPEESEEAGSQGKTPVRGVAILSTSAGISSFPADGTDPGHLVHLADTALYDAKRRGRNRVCAYNSGSGIVVASDFDNRKSERRRYVGFGDTDPELDANVARESRASSNDYLQAVYAMATAIEMRDGYTHGHSERVAFYAVRLGEAAGLGSDEIAALRIAGLLHDIGKISVPYDVLNKSGKLSADEWEIVRQHPLQGEGILRPLRNFSKVWPNVVSHHENYDGSGYPRNLRETEIPTGGRILRIADAYEVMTVAGRAYQKEAKSPTEAVAELRRCAGTMFDPHLVDLFISQVIGDPSRSIAYNPRTRRASDDQMARQQATTALDGPPTNHLTSGDLLDVVIEK
jgi:diguanylate cyclase (GGDEF)-like protein